MFPPYQLKSGFTICVLPPCIMQVSRRPRTDATRLPGHVHVHISAVQFIQHLVKAFQPGCVQFCFHDPAKVIVLLIKRALKIYAMRLHTFSAFLTNIGMGFFARLSFGLRAFAWLFHRLDSPFSFMRPLVERYAAKCRHAPQEAGGLRMPERSS